MREILWDFMIQADYQIQAKEFERILINKQKKLLYGVFCR